MSIFDGALGSLSDIASGVSDGVKDALQDMGTASNIPLRGVLWEIDVIDEQGFTLTPLGRGILAAAALYGGFKLLGGK
ncbi:hypothetical protein JI58_02205 [Marinosulfonomonas sp. PRT-SC04]|nr:hypothetical protein JI58_02205 [Marinosulfonomonas sp. PRT-SC04]